MPRTNVFMCFLSLQISSDLSIMDLDVPLSLIYSVASTINVCSALVVLAVVTWQVLFVCVLMIYLAISLQVMQQEVLS
jgi:ATP-binding cassette subfamily C (CFTR/MRP) protein 2